MIFDLPSVNVIKMAVERNNSAAPRVRILGSRHCIQGWESLKADKILIREIRDQGSVVVRQAIVTPQWLDGGEGHHPQQNVAEKGIDSLWG